MRQREAVRSESGADTVQYGRKRGDREAFCLFHETGGMRLPRFAFSMSGFSQMCVFSSEFDT